MVLLKVVVLECSALGNLNWLVSIEQFIDFFAIKTTYVNLITLLWFFSQEMIIWSDLVYRCNDHVPEVIYNELPPRLQAEVEIDTTRPPAPVVQSRKRRKKRNDEATGEEWEELFDDDEL